MTGPFLACIGEAAEKGEIDPDVAKEAAEVYSAAFDASSATLGPADADRAAAKVTLDALERAEIEARRRRALQIRSRRAILAAIGEQKRRRGYSNVNDLGPPGGDGKPPKGGWFQGGEPPREGPLKNGGVFARALPLIMRNKAGLSGLPMGSVEGRELAIRGGFDAGMAALIEKFQAGLDANLFHARNRATLSNVVREAFGEKTGDQAAAELAKAWGETAERARLMFNAAGGQIGKLDRWGLPQMHDAGKIYAAGKDAWVQFTLSQLAPERMFDRDANAPFTPKRLAYVLSQTYDRIITRGLIDREPGESPGVGMLANRRAEERFLTFKDADAWSRYQGQFGQGDAFGAMMHHLDGMARDVALMQILGPNPEAQWRWLVNAATKEAAMERLGGVESAERSARSQIRRGQDMFDSFTGKANVPVNERFARYAATARAYLTAADLGGVILTDMPSAPVFGAMARSFMGLNGDVGQLMKLLALPEARATARRMDFINDVARDGLFGTTQDSLRLMSVGEQADEGFNAFSRRLPTAVMRLQGLEGAFEARKRSFRLSFMGALADAAGTPLADLMARGGQDAKLATELMARGFSEDDWKAIGAAEKWEPSPGASFLRPREIEASAGQELALRVGEMVLNAEQLAVPVSGSLWSRSYLMGGARPGTWRGEGLRSFLMFRTFVVNVAHLYGEEIFLRGVRSGLTGAGLNAYMGAWAAGVVGMMTLGGLMSLQLKALAAGKDPLSIQDERTWEAALLQGGGFGLLGDFLFAKQARNDKSGPIATVGPVGELADDMRLSTVGFAQDLANPRESREQAWHAEAGQLNHDLRSYTPFASLWWARTAFDRDIVDQLQAAVDPDARRAFQRSGRQLMLDSGQGEWWPRGQLVPSRAPDLGAALAPPPARHAR